jgi:TadE-like protein
MNKTKGEGMKKAVIKGAWLGRRVRGATLAEFVVAFPTLLMLLLSLAQTALVFHAKSNLNYATFEAARAGSMSNANVESIRAAFRKGMIGYYGGGSSTVELAKTLATKVFPDMLPSASLPTGAVRVEIISPSKESFTDYASPELSVKYKTSARVIPNANINYLSCPRDRTGCASNPSSNASGQTLADANLLKIRVTYGIPPAKQVPLIGRFYTWALSKMNIGDTDAFRVALVAAGRIPVVTHATIRMQSDAIENSNMKSIPGKGNEGKPTDPGTAVYLPPPACPFWDPTCVTCKDGLGKPPCEVSDGDTPVDPGGGTCTGSDCPVCTGPASAPASAPASSAPASASTGG